MKARIRVFAADEDTPSCLRYIEGHRMVLESYGVPKVTSSKAEWLDDPNTYIIIVESENSDKILGGGRIQLRTKKLLMPMEDAISKVDSTIYTYMSQYGFDHSAEFCGLFNSKEVAGYGIGSIFLGRVGVAVAGILKLENLFALCSPATLRNCLKVGFKVIREIGNNGTYYYPKQDLIATALIIDNLQQLPSANETERMKIQNLIENPTQSSVEQGPKGEMSIQYDLRINKHQTHI